MDGSRRLVGFSIIDPEGRYPDLPDYGVPYRQDAEDEADALNTDFSEERGDSAYGVMAIYDDGTAEHLP